jgi:DNA-binding MarR family transcriptional regulator
MVALRKVVRFLRLADREAEATTGLSAAQLYILHCLAEAPSGSMSELAERTMTDPSSVSTVIDRLVRRGLVKRVRAREDLRRFTLRLSPIGQRVIRTAPRAPQELIANALGAMPVAERKAVLIGLEILGTAIGATETPPKMLFEDEPTVARRSSRARRTA